MMFTSNFSEDVCEVRSSEMCLGSEASEHTSVGHLGELFLTDVLKTRKKKV